MEIITMRVLQLEESKQKGIPLRASVELEAVAELIIYNGRVIKNRYGSTYESSNPVVRGATKSRTSPPRCSTLRV